MIVALDIGLKRIGIAMSPDGRVAIPYRPVLRKGRKQAAADIKRLLEEWQVDTLVIGIPVGGSSEEEMGRRIRHFVGLLGLPESVDIHYQDEADSSKEAKESMMGVIKQRRDGRIDSLAAQIILQRWLERRL